MEISFRKEEGTLEMEGRRTFVHFTRNSNKIRSKCYYISRCQIRMRFRRKISRHHVPDRTRAKLHKDPQSNYKRAFANLFRRDSPVRRDKFRLRGRRRPPRPLVKL